jgi:hypothetical protein
VQGDVDREALKHEIALGRYEIAAHEVAEAILRRAALVRRVRLTLAGAEAMRLQASSDQPGIHG